MHDVEDAVRDAGLLEQLGRPVRRGRVLLGGLEHERVAAGERRRPHPHRHHRGEVERRDPGDDAERLPDRVDVDPGRGLLGHAALEQGRDPAGELDHLEPAGDLAERVGEHLAVLGREDARNLLAAVVHELADPEHQLGPLRERGGAPRGERRLRGGDRGTDLLGRRQVDLAALLPERRVVDGSGAAGRSLDGLAADPVADAGERFALLGGRGRELGHALLLEIVARSVARRVGSTRAPRDRRAHRARARHPRSGGDARDAACPDRPSVTAARGRRRRAADDARRRPAPLCTDRSSGLPQSTLPLQRLAERCSTSIGRVRTDSALAHVPLGTSSSLGGISQDWVVTTVRGGEIVSDPTSVLALECALRRRRDRTRPVRLSTTHRVLRAQVFEPPFTQHFGMLALCAADRPEAKRRF